MLLGFRYLLCVSVRVQSIDRRGWITGIHPLILSIREILFCKKYESIELFVIFKF